jgi:hypothetical protein
MIGPARVVATWQPSWRPVCMCCVTQPGVPECVGSVAARLLEVNSQGRETVRDVV